MSCTICGHDGKRETVKFTIRAESIWVHFSRSTFSLVIEACKAKELRRFIVIGESAVDADSRAGVDHSRTEIKERKTTESEEERRCAQHRITSIRSSSSHFVIPDAMQGLTGDSSQEMKTPCRITHRYMRRFIWHSEKTRRSL